MFHNTKRFLITGGNFTNKGAQSMLFVTVDEIKRRFNDSEIFILPLDDYKIYNENLTFRAIQNHSDLYELDGKKSTLFKLLCKNMARFLLLKKTYIFSELFNYPKLMRTIDLIIDISGFCLSSQFDNSYNMTLIHSIDEAKKYRIPIVLMPQSFGPFDYINNRAEMLNAIKSAITYPYAIFAREKDGFEQLINTFGAQNIRKSVDLVLQNKGVNLDNIFKSRPPIKEIHAKINSVALIPNSMNIEQSDHNKTVQYYKSIVEFLQFKNRNVYIVGHSNLDYNLCKDIFSSLKDTTSVELIEEELMSYEFDRFVRQMDFLVASRYHSIVHAYRNYVPCVILGWSIKYNELAKIVRQESMTFDIRYSSIEDILSAVTNMCSNFQNESKVIENQVVALQNSNCFDVLNEIIK